jgi:hypothetical protein
VSDAPSTVYILGAGVNKVIRSAYGAVSPPLIRDFFQVARQLDYWPGAEAALQRERGAGAVPYTQGQR